METVTGQPHRASRGQCICCAFTTCPRKNETKASFIATVRCRPAFATRAEGLHQVSFVSSNWLSCPCAAELLELRVPSDSRQAPNVAGARGHVTISTTAARQANQPDSVGFHGFSSCFFELLLSFLSEQITGFTRRIARCDAELLACSPKL